MTSKFPYVTPTITVNIIELEYAIAAGSATVLADDGNFQMFEDWQEEEDVRRTIDW